MSTAPHPSVIPDERRSALFDRVAGGFLGAGLPLLVSSEVTASVVVAIGLVLILLAPGRASLLAALAQTLKSPGGLACLAVLASWIPGLVVSIRPLQSLSAFGTTAGLMLAAGLIHVFLVRSSEARELCLKALVIAGLACGALALIAANGGSVIYAPFRGRAFEPFQAEIFIKYYASAVACLAPVVLLAGLRLGGAWRSAALAYPAMALAIILSLRGGAGLLGLVAAAVVFALILAGHRPPLGRPALGLLALLVAIFLAGIGWLFAHAPSPPPLEAMAGGVYNGPIETPLPLMLVDAHRQQIWGFSLAQIGNAPWFGHGLDTSNFLPGAHTKIFILIQEFVPSHPHDWIIEILVDSGFIGLAGVIGAFVVLAARWLGIARVDRLRAAAGLGLLAAYATSSLLNFSLWSAWWQTEFLVLCAILLALPSAPEAGRKVRPS